MGKMSRPTADLYRAVLLHKKNFEILGGSGVRRILRQRGARFPLIFNVIYSAAGKFFAVFLLYSSGAFTSVRPTNVY